MNYEFERSENSVLFKLLIAFGSNLGDREKNIADAITMLREKITIEKISPLYETDPLYDDKEKNTAQNKYLNGALYGQTNLSAPELLTFCLSIEKKIGRVRPAPRYSAREIDLDILFYGTEIINTPELQIPHPRLHERQFVLQPLNNIAPNWLHPQLQKTVGELLLLANHFHDTAVKMI